MESNNLVLFYLPFCFSDLICYIWKIKQGSGKAHYGMCMGGAVKVSWPLFCAVSVRHIFRRGIPEIYETVYFHEGNIVRFSKLPGYPRQVLVPVGFILLSLTCFPV